MTSPATRPTALIVETNYLLASVMEAPLVTAGYQVLVATDLDQAFQLLEQHPVQIALIDFRLRHIGPDGLVAKLQSRGIPFIFCTASSQEEVNEHFPDARVILKPFSDDQLLQAVSQLSETTPTRSPSHDGR